MISSTNPALQGRTKPKYVVMLSGSALDDPLVYILTTSEKTKHADHPFPNDLVVIQGSPTTFFPVNILIDEGEAGQLEIGREEFVVL
jgi:hypothetical protein